MKVWNKLFIEKGRIEDCLIEMLNIHELSDSCIEIIELLYTRGLMNSSEIQKIIKPIIENKQINSEK